MPLIEAYNGKSLKCMWREMRKGKIEEKTLVFKWLTDDLYNKVHFYFIGVVHSTVLLHSIFRTLFHLSLNIPFCLPSWRCPLNGSSQRKSPTCWIYPVFYLLPCLNEWIEPTSHDPLYCLTCQSPSFILCCTSWRKHISGDEQWTNGHVPGKGSFSYLYI